MKKMTLLVIGMILIFHAQSIAYEGGSGIPEDPYQINNLDQLKQLSETSSDWDKHFILTADIDATATSTWNSGNGFSPIGNTSTNFVGSLNGQNHIISNLVCNLQYNDYRGLFGYVANSSLINIGLVNCTIKGKEYVGALAGRVVTTVVSNCYAKDGRVQGANGNVVAGLIGTAQSQSAISYCYVDMEVHSAYGYVGGLVGNLLYESTMSYCYSIKRVNSTNTYDANNFGNLMARNYTSTVQNCYAIGAVNGNMYVGGLTGSNSSTTDLTATISNCYAAGPVSGGSGLGGFIAYNQGASVVSGCYYDTELTGQASAIAYDDNGQSVTGYTTAQFATQGNFSGWDFEDVWEIATITEYDANPRPYLQWQFGYDLAFQTDGNGTINGSAVQTVKRADDAEQVEAIPSVGFQFVEWQGNLGSIYSTDNPLTIKNVENHLELMAIFSSTTAVENLNAPDINIYPNPTQGILHVRAERMNKIEMMDMQGRCVYMVSKACDEMKLDISHCSKGIYLLKVTIDEGTVLRKIAVD